jgi:hypothetical protein
VTRPPPRIAVAGFSWWSWFLPGLLLVLICTNLVGDLLDETLNRCARFRGVVAAVWRGMSRQIEIR